MKCMIVTELSINVPPLRRISAWFRRFVGKQSDDDQEKFYHDVHGNNETPVSFYQLVSMTI
jgi:hypothetical protein